MDKKEQLDFKKLVKRKSVLFIITSPVNPALHPFANLVLGTMFKELFEFAEDLESGQLPIPLMTICDDFAVGGQIPNFSQLISIFREKGISVMMLVQSLSQLAGMYGEKAAIDNGSESALTSNQPLPTAIPLTAQAATNHIQTPIIQFCTADKVLEECKSRISEDSNINNDRKQEELAFLSSLSAEKLSTLSQFMVERFVNGCLLSKAYSLQRKLPHINRISL